jgi:hypothetical protein
MIEDDCRAREWIHGWCGDDLLTLGVQEVIDQHVVTAIGLDGGVLIARRRAVTHVLLAQRLNMSVDVGSGL